CRGKAGGRPRRRHRAGVGKTDYGGTRRFSPPGKRAWPRIHVDPDPTRGSAMKMSRLLIVEDDPAIAIALEDDLRLEGYDVERVQDGEAAVKRAREAAFDLIVLDVMLPKKDGFDV